MPIYLLTLGGLLLCCTSVTQSHLVTTISGGVTPGGGNGFLDFSPPTPFLTPTSLPGPYSGYPRCFRGTVPYSRSAVVPISPSTSFPPGTSPDSLGRVTFAHSIGCLSLQCSWCRRASCLPLLRIWTPRDKFCRSRSQRLVLPRIVFPVATASAGSRCGGFAALWAGRQWRRACLAYRFCAALAFYRLR